ncbi:helicase [Streptomyces longisporoflavus]|uniref:DEAD/DEAH box helicase n=1 Tax=Streptomyces longisporoflavus TaxID=28044 RepID=UPI0019CC6C32|nr:DEAD/DEAH box helicase [Streptomyces longisporoflavus]GGV44245.1 helicase [Streptomyces longisporoflavus]
MTLPVALSGTDVIGQAKTGTGKTLGFGLPLLERVTVPADVEAGRAKPEQLTDAPQALIVVPTRELCQQVTNDLLTAGKARNVRVLAIYGGRAYEPQVEALKKGIDIVVGTPGRLLDLAGQKKLNLKHIKCLVLDEADEMLDLGFLPDVERIINMLPPKRQTMLFSATMPGAVIGLARRYMSQPTHIRATAPDDEGQTVANTKQHVYRAHNMDKPEMVSRILQAEGRGLAMIFCRTKRTAADIAEQLEKRGFAAGAVHGDLGQGAREQALRAFRNGKVDVLVCTDVAARGIDVGGVTHVINYQSPEDEKTYLHRIGRTGRAGAKGIAITLVDWDDIPRWQLINKALDLGLSDPVETYSSSPHLYEELDIPAGTKGVLPRAERTRAGLRAEEVEDLGETGGKGGSRGRDRDRGGRGRDGGRDGGRDRDRGHASEPEREPREARTPRRRRRTRSGAPLETPSTAAAPVAEAAPTAALAAPAAPAAEPTEPRTPRRRRRTRGGSEAAEAAVDTVNPVNPVNTVEAEAVETTPAPVEAPATKPRRRTRKAAEAAEAAVDTAEAVESTEVEAPAAKPRRRTRKAAEAAVDTAEAVESTEADAPATKPRRRTRKAAEAAVDTAEAVESTEAEAPATKPRRRTRKAAEAVVDTAEAEVPATKPRRTRKAAEPVVEAAEAAETDAPAAKPRRRTRKAAEPVVETAETVDADAPAEKPRRRTRKAAETAEAVVDTVEAVDTEAPAAKPRRRTRKTAEAEIPAQPTEETKPRRRTRKAAETPAVAEEEPTVTKPRRRARKAVAAPAEES